MKKQKVYVLVEYGRDNISNSYMTVVGVYTTKTAAKEQMNEEKERIRNKFFSDENGYEFEKDECEEFNEGAGSWTISATDYPVFSELDLIEKEVEK